MKRSNLGAHAALVIFVCLLPAMVSSYRAQASGRLVVQLMYFRGSEQDDGVLLEWATGSENDTVGFRVERAESEDGPYAELDVVGFVPANGDAFEGGTYSEVDSSAEIDGERRTYWYRLFEVDTTGGRTQQATTSVSVGADEQQPVGSPAAGTATPTIAATAQSTMAATQTAATPVPTATPLVSTSDQRSASQPPYPSSSGDSVAEAASESAAQAGTATSEAYPAFETPLDSQPAESPQESYPAPSEIQSQPTVGSVSAPQVTSPLGQSPIATSSADRIGSGQQLPVDQRTAAQESQQSLGPVLFLWLGFLASLLIFVAGVVGSILFFTRQRSKGS